MSGGTISGNTVSSSYSDSYSYGGGVCVSSGTSFTMSGGTISGNTASAYYYGYGGGVFVDGGAFFTKQGGTIYGSNASSLYMNTADYDGHAVYVSSGSKKRNTTAGTGVTLNSSVSGSSGGWE
jgi:hypothetical protein